MRVRDFLRRAADLEWNVEYAGERLKLARQHAQRLVAGLLELGYIEMCKSTDEGEWYKRTLAGATFSLASAAQPLRRKTARKKLDEFMKRVRTINTTENFLYRVKRVIVFGSYLHDGERINDIDVAVELVHRESDPERRQAVDKERIEEAIRAGRQFRNLVDELFWPYQEVLLFLKARSRAIGLHTTDDPILKTAESRVIYEMNADSISTERD